MALASTRRRGFSLIELLVVIAILMVVAAISIPHMQSTLANSREMAAVREIKTVQAAQTQYMGQFGEYAEGLAQLGPPVSGLPGPAGADLIPGALSTGQKSGYLFTVARTKAGYTVTAVPRTPGSGRRSFYSDQSLAIRQNWGDAPATAGSPELQ